jgi:hypothetical protein
MDAEDSAQLRENAGFLADRGALVDADEIADRLGITLAQDPEDALGAMGGSNANDASNGSDGDQGKLARLQALVEQALKEANGNAQINNQ